MARGVFITFEGPEGSGKSLQSRLLVERLRAEGHEVLATREPGGTPLGDEVRRLALLRPDLEITARTETLLMCAARAQLVETVIVPALADGQIVVCDRFGDSTLAYQGAGRGLPVDDLRRVIAFATAGLTPDLSVLLDVPVEVGLARKGHQVADAGSGDNWNRFEAEARAFHERIRQAYLALARDEPERWLVLDGALLIEALQRRVWERASGLLSAISPAL